MRVLLGNPANLHEVWCQIACCWGVFLGVGVLGGLIYLALYPHLNHDLESAVRAEPPRPPMYYI